MQARLPVFNQCLGPRVRVSPPWPFSLQVRTCQRHFLRHPWFYAYMLIGGLVLQDCNIPVTAVATVR
jgi:hypothetical protein